MENSRRIYKCGKTAQEFVVVRSYLDLVLGREAKTNASKCSLAQMPLSPSPFSCIRSCDEVGFVEI